ncbi:hypothetical protein [Variovorax guangxiensis]|nr:hypothetical protein [Variovorax guangxiensis]MDR6861087.1 hypothetical protein [Variovorax guangxiensis]
MESKVKLVVGESERVYAYGDGSEVFDYGSEEAGVDGTEDARDWIGLR